MKILISSLLLLCNAATVIETFTTTTFTPAKGSYTGSQTETSTISGSGQWTLSDQTLLATSDTGCIGGCVRLKKITGGNPFVATKFAITGITSLSVLHRSYGTDAASTWIFEKSTDQVTWTQYGVSHTTSLSAVTVVDSVTLTGAYYIRVRITSNVNGVRMNIDDFKWITSAGGSVCGNGAVESGETCDDGNTTSGDGCSSVCATESGFACAGSPSVCDGICGDGLVKGTETCDDGSTTSGNGCSSSCQIESGYTCSGQPSTCSAVCGDGLIKGTEVCDDNNIINGDGCSSSCLVESGWSCTGTPSVCTSSTTIIENFFSATPAKGAYAGAQVETCTTGSWNFADQTILATGEASCGTDLKCPRLKVNGFVATMFTIAGINSLSVRHQTYGADATATWRFQTSPDGVTWTNYGAARTSTTTSAIAVENISVGSSVRIRVLMTAGTNRMNIDDFKWSTGTVTTVCGDGVITGAETCDDANTASGDGCSSSCQIESGYTCSGTPSICIIPPIVCGNGVVEAGEACDDDNNVNGDGCSSTCAIESGWGCNDQPSYCTPIQSNGIITGYEQCDDGNAVDTDGCSNSGVIKKGYTCTGTPSVCTLVATPGCGNGIVEAGEACDDGNKVSTDGCSSTCTIEPGYTCATNSDGLFACNLITNNPTPPFTGYLAGYLPQPFANPAFSCSTSSASLVCGVAEPASGSYSSCCQSGGGYPLITLAQQWIPGYCAKGTCNTNVQPAWAAAGGNFFTMHGIWPDTCSGGFGPANGCDGRVSGCVSGAPCPKMSNYLDQYPALKADMRTYWPTAASNDNEYFWAHEWDKHGTCHNSFKAACSLGTCSSNSWVSTCTDKYDYFSHGLNMRKTNDLYSWFAAAGITPRTEAAGTYTLLQFVNAIKAVRGNTNPGLINCVLVSGKYYLQEVHLFFLVDQRFHNIPAPATGSSSCPATGIIYLPYP